ncbi:MAG: DNA repair protein RecN [Gammaproteobacteria bacterium]|nr:DNA repair protein RecN [Gammaproteobacteria bacterium]MDH3406326.1 DNA repair protein RecN [Gammaproteobacteria bacterium]MDH5487466.1 DNA repair protein RecN [Gammaproteobacteria bacterium]
MLTQLYVRDFAIVRELSLSYEPGFTVLTGETGAGKSILIDALALVLGERAEVQVIRHGCPRTEVTATFSLKPSHDAAKWLKENDLFGDQECVLRRLVEIDKPSRGFINGRPVPIQMLRELGEHLVDIHGQHEHQSLLRRDSQRQILDDYAELEDTVATLTHHYREMESLRERLASLKQQSADREARMELLRYQVRELEALGLTAEEIPTLEEEHARLANGAELIEGVQTLVQTLQEGEEATVSQQLARAINRLDSLVKFDAKLGEVASLLNEASIQIDEAGSRLNQYLENLELDPSRLQAVERRLSTVHDLARKHKLPPEELPACHQRLRTELNDIENLDTSLSQLEENLEKAHKAYLKIAADVSRLRQHAAKKLVKAVTTEMQELGMPGGSFQVDLTSLPEGETSAYGLERVEFLVSANPGTPVRALSKVASGGELSRISLALQVVAAGSGRIPTLIFDEVDVGIGGSVAEVVGRKLRALGRSRQVLCITHLAQVAAQGTQHVQVRKLTEGKDTLAEAVPLAERERTLEIARMIGGVEISKQTLAHAKDMLTRASA